MPTQQRRKSAAAINKLWVQVMGLELFNEAQRKVPVQTGKLKNSGGWVAGENNIIISYPVSYAYDLHEGTNKGELMSGVGFTDFPWVATTRAHSRKIPSGKIVRVRKHKKTYKKYYKPTLTPKGWAAINYQSKSDVEGIKWVQKAWTKVRNRQPRDIRNELPKNLVISKSNLQNVV